MRKDTEKVKLAHNGKALATMHGFSADDQKRLEQALRASAKTIAPKPIGKDRNALYASHKEQLLTQFQSHWDRSKASDKWTKSSISKILSNYLFDYNKHQGTSKTVSKKKAVRKTHAPKPKASEPKHIVSYLKEDSPPESTVRPLRNLKSPFTFRPINQRSPSPSDRLVKGLSESPFDKPQNSRIDSVLPFTQHSPPDPESEDLEPLSKLAETIVVVRPSSSDPHERTMISFPLWRCQNPVNGRDAAPEFLHDWRDLSFTDFLRQLKAEQALNPGEMVVWGDYNQVLTSNMTFAGAVQEQLQAAPYNDSALNEATFMVVSSKSLASILEGSFANIWSESKMTE
ncbi:unnamed protein product [Aureobasidium vineae]|uniref:Uncharacterized protein n=1 Tax=Aureobasidium vineae TaxID=2773715 RepID=A0A9N8JBI9_9PEZI|nr:unnamed protein product [Aureobasidium vineae]